MRDDTNHFPACHTGLKQLPTMLLASQGSFLESPRDLAQRTGVLLVSQAQPVCCTTSESNHAMQGMSQMDVTHLQKQVRTSLFAGVARDGNEAAHALSRRLYTESRLQPFLTPGLMG